MALYSNALNTFLYKYNKPIYITETSGQDRNVIPMSLNLNTSNFNFDLAKSDGLDLRIADRQNGTGVFLMWVAHWDADNNSGTVWFKLPYLAANDTRQVWLFWGNESDAGISDMYSLVDDDPVFLFAEGFDDETLDISRWPDDVQHRVGSWILNNSVIELTTNSWIRSVDTLGGETSVYTGSHTAISGTDGLWGTHNATGNCYLGLTYESFFSGFTTLVDGVLDSYHPYSYIGAPGCAIGIDFGEATDKISKLGLYLYYPSESYNGELSVPLTSYLSVYRSYENNSDWELVYTFTHEEIGIPVKVQDYVWYYELDFISPGTEGRYFLFIGDNNFSELSGVFYYTEIVGFRRESIVTSNPGRFILEEGIKGIASPTSTTSYAHRIQFVGGENPFEIQYFWEGATDRNHNFIDSESVQTDAGAEKGLEIGSYARLHTAYYEKTDRIYQGMLNRANYSDYEDSWERKVHRNTECSSFRLWGHNASSSNGIQIDWVVAREYNPAIEPSIDLSNLYIEYEYISHQIVDYTEYGTDITSTDFYHSSDMGGDPYNMSDNLSIDLLGAFVSDSGITQGSILIDFGRLSTEENNKNYLHLDSDHVGYYTAAKLSELDQDIYGNTYWSTTTTSGWAAIRFPTRRTISTFKIHGVASNLTGMAKNYNFYGSNSDPRFSGWTQKALLKTGIFLQQSEEQVIYLNNTSSYFYYILEVIDTYGSNIAIQEWAMYRRTPEIGKKVVSQLRLKPVVDNINEYYFPKQIKLEASNDLINWDILLNTTNTPTPFINYVYGRWSRYSFDNYESYYAYRLTCYDNWRTGQDIIKISEWEMVERIEEASVYRILGGSTSNINSVWADDSTNYDSGHFYIVNDVLSTIKINALVETTTISGITSDINVKGT